MTYHEVYDPETDYDNCFGRGDLGVAETEDAYYVIFSGHTDETGFSTGFRSPESQKGLPKQSFFLFVTAKEW